MLDNYFSASKMLGHLRSGPSGLHLDGFAAALKRQGYTDDTAVRYVRAAAHPRPVLAGRGGIAPAPPPPAPPSKLSPPPFPPPQGRPPQHTTHLPAPPPLP